jgi:hypothetical protein
MRALLIAAVALFLIAAVSAFTVSVNVNEPGFIALGLAAFAGSHLANHYGYHAGAPVQRAVDQPVAGTAAPRRRRWWVDPRV